MLGVCSLRSARAQDAKTRASGVMKPQANSREPCGVMKPQANSREPCGVMKLAAGRCRMPLGIGSAPTDYRARVTLKMAPLPRELAHRRERHYTGCVCASFRRIKDSDFMDERYEVS